MINQIEDAIVACVTTRLDAGIGKIAVQKGVEGLVQPAVYVSTEEGRFKKIGQRTYRQTLGLFVDIMFSYRGSGDGERRKGIYLILEGILQALLLQDFGLDITPLELGGWKNTTTEDLRKQGLIAFSLEASVSHTISRIDDEAIADLLAVGLNYYLKPGDDQPDAIDLVTLSPEGE